MQHFFMDHECGETAILILTHRPTLLHWRESTKLVINLKITVSLLPHVNYY